MCRSGALTIAEISNVGLASILVPYPYAVDDHQTSNASLLKQAGAAQVLDDSALKAQTLADCLRDNFLNVEQRQRMANNAKQQAKPNATRDVVEHILQEVNS